MTPDAKDGVGELLASLTSVHASRVLMRAARAGFISQAECAMPVCYCPGGTSHFDPSGRPLAPWMPTADHRKRKMDGGTLALTNVRLAHRLCNFADYAKGAGISFERYLEKACSEWAARYGGSQGSRIE